MLAAHKVIDALKGNGKLSLEMASGCPAGYCNTLASKISDAAKFDFGTLPLVCRDDIEVDQTTIAPEWMHRAAPKISHFIPPEITRNEIEWWAEGYFPIPYPIVWYEFDIKNSPMTVGALISTNGNEWVIDFVGIYRGSIGVTGATISIELCPSSVRNIGTHEEDIKFSVSGNMLSRGKSYDLIVRSWASKIKLVLWLTISLNSKSTDKRTETASPKLNKNRIERGRSPMFDHTVIDLLPSRYIERSSSGSHHASPRAHKRRSHLRHFGHKVANGKLVESGEHAGQWAVVIPWCWVNKTDSDVLTQTYQVRMDK